MDHNVVCRSRIQFSDGCQFSAGAFGGGGGKSFNELPDDCRAVIRKIVLRSADRIDAIQVTYRLSSGKDYTGPKRGGNGGTEHKINIDIDGGERIIGVFGRAASRVDMLGFVTNKGRIFGHYGRCGGTKFTVNSCHLRGIFGRSGSEIDSIGFHCSHP
jgi:hypothetical protein